MQNSITCRHTALYEVVERIIVQEKYEYAYYLGSLREGFLEELDFTWVLLRDIFTDISKIVLTNLQQS